MGQLHNELRRTAISDALKNALGASKSDGGVERYGETLTPVIDLFRQPEWAVLRKDVLFAGFLTAAAVAGEQSGVALINPAGSNLIVVVERLSAWGSATGLRLTRTVTVADIQATFALGLVCQPRDDRALGGVLGAQTRVELWQGTDVGGLGGVNSEILPIAAATLTEAISTPYVVMPGRALLAESNGNNLTVTVNFAGRVRTAFPGELV